MVYHPSEPPEPAEPVLRSLLPRHRGGCGHGLTPGLTALTGIDWSSSDLTTLLEGLGMRRICRVFISYMVYIWIIYG